MRSALAASLLATLLFAGPALAEGPGFVGNTIKSETPTWGTLAFYVGADGAYTASDGTAGNWTYTEGTLCFNPSTGAAPLCGPFDAAKQAGDSWEDAAWDGNGTAKVSLVAGEALSP